MTDAIAVAAAAVARPSTPQSGSQQRRVVGGCGGGGGVSRVSGSATSTRSRATARDDEAALRNPVINEPHGAADHNGASADLLESEPIKDKNRYAAGTDTPSSRTYWKKKIQSRSSDTVRAEPVSGESTDANAVATTHSTASTTDSHTRSGVPFGGVATAMRKRKKKYIDPENASLVDTSSETDDDNNDDNDDNNEDDDVEGERNSKDDDKEQTADEHVDAAETVKPVSPAASTSPSVGVHDGPLASAAVAVALNSKPHTRNSQLRPVVQRLDKVSRRPLRKRLGTNEASGPILLWRRRPKNRCQTAEGEAMSTVSVPTDGEAPTASSTPKMRTRSKHAVAVKERVAETKTPATTSTTTTTTTTPPTTPVSTTFEQSLPSLLPSKQSLNHLIQTNIVEFCGVLDLNQLHENLYNRHMRFLLSKADATTTRVMTKVLHRDRFRLQQVIGLVEKISKLLYYYFSWEYHEMRQLLVKKKLAASSSAASASGSASGDPRAYVFSKKDVDAARLAVCEAVRSSLPLTRDMRFDHKISEYFDSLVQTLKEEPSRSTQTFYAKERVIYEAMKLPNIFASRSILIPVKNYIRSYLLRVLRCSIDDNPTAIDTLTDRRNGSDATSGRVNSNPTTATTPPTSASTTARDKSYANINSWRKEYEKFYYTHHFLQIINYKFLLYHRHCEVILANLTKQSNGPTEQCGLKLLPSHYYRTTEDPNFPYCFYSVLREQRLFNTLESDTNAPCSAPPTPASLHGNEVGIGAAAGASPTADLDTVTGCRQVSDAEVSDAEPEAIEVVAPNDVQTSADPATTRKASSSSETQDAEVIMLDDRTPVSPEDDKSRVFAEAAHSPPTNDSRFPRRTPDDSNEPQSLTARCVSDFRSA